MTLLTGSLKARRAADSLEAIATGQAGIVVGTHALIQEAVSFADLALAVVDEQHRFGVDQRGALEAKATRGAPHVLLMTATPIPRTLGQVLYADLDVSDPPHGTGGPRPDPDRASGAPTSSRGRGTRCARRRPRTAGRSWSCHGSAPRAKADATAEETDGFFEDDELIDEDVETAWAAAAEAEFERLTGLLAPLRVGSSTAASSPPTAMARWRASATATSTSSWARRWWRSAST